MGKAILYFMLFVCITLLMIGCGMLLAGFIVSQGLYDHVGIAKDEVVIFVVMLMGVLWSLGTCWLFVHNGYGSFSWGNLGASRRISVVALSAVLFIAVDVLAFCCHHLLEPFSDEYTQLMSLYRSHPLITLVTLVMMYVTVQTVFLSSILRQLVSSLRRHRLALTIVAVTVALPNLQEGTVGVVMFLFAVASGLIEGWLYLRTRSIWPAVVGPVVGDYVLWMVLGNTPSWWMGIASVVMIPPVLWLLHRQLVSD
jgi:membrane protease YdiL (CAAX protease family)